MSTPNSYAEHIPTYSLLVLTTLLILYVQYVADGILPPPPAPPEGPVDRPTLPPGTRPPVVPPKDEPWPWERPDKKWPPTPAS